MPQHEPVLYVADRAGRRTHLDIARPGDVLVAEVARPTAPALDRVLQARREAPWAPLLVLAADERADALVRVGSLAADAGARAVTRRLDAEWPEVLDRLCRCESLPADFERWMIVVRPDLRRATVRRTASLVAAGMSGRRVGDVAEESGITARDLEAGFRHARMPPPSKYVQFGRLMPGLSLLARRPGVRLIDAADASNYATASAFIRVLTATVRVRAEQARRQVGFEWVACAMRLHGREGKLG
jgi:AraC-like DNA-binding protein